MFGGKSHQPRKHCKQINKTTMNRDKFLDILALPVLVTGDFAEEEKTRKPNLWLGNYMWTVIHKITMFYFDLNNTIWHGFLSHKEIGTTFLNVNILLLFSFACRLVKHGLSTCQVLKSNIVVNRTGTRKQEIHTFRCLNIIPFTKVYFFLFNLYNFCTYSSFQLKYKEGLNYLF